MILAAESTKYVPPYQAHCTRQKAEASLRRLTGPAEAAQLQA